MSTHRTPDEFRAELMSPVAFHRVKALHALECRGEAIEGLPLGQQLMDFVSRGIPYFAPDDAHYSAWVDLAVKYWERLDREGRVAAVA